ncbi:MAG: hypothetical protein ACRDH6_09020 [Actinomycetota bacterium]
MNRRISVAIGLAVALSLVLGEVPAGAADPPSGTITPKTPTVEWSGPLEVVGANLTGQGGANECPLPAVVSCDVFELTVDVPASGWSATGGVNVSITFTSANSDFDLYVYNEAGELVGSSTGSFGAPETVILPRASGVFMVTVSPFFVVNDQYAGTATAFGLAKKKPKKKKAR